MANDLDQKSIGQRIIHRKKPFEKRSFGQKAADALTTFAGSWTFIIMLIIFMLLWITLNLYAGYNHWDPYPFILLNFVLSTLAAIQAPIILMSQNREAERDRIKAEYNYHVNEQAKAEIEDMQRDLDEIKELIKGLKNIKE